MKWKADRKKFLNKFITENGLGKYNKIEYPRWRALSRSTMPYLIIDRELKTADELEDWHVMFNVICNPGKEDEFCLTFQYCDNSMGEFIGDHFQDPDLSFDCDKKEIDNMNNNDWLKQYATTSYAVKSDTNTASNYTITSDITGASDNYYTNTTTTYPYNGDTATWVYVPNEAAEINTKRCRELIKEILNENKEKEKMDTSKMFNFDFGPVSGSQFRMSPYGLAVRTAANGWVAFNAQSGELMDVEVLNFDVSKMIYKMPVTLGVVSVGDILIHGGKPVFVRSVGDGVINVIDYSTASVMDILPVKSPFGFNFFTKVVCLVDMSGMSAASPENPFGGLLPFLMLGDGKDIDPMMFMLMGGNMNFASNPMMMYFLLNRDGKDNSNLLPLLMMMNAGTMPSNNAGPATI